MNTEYISKTFLLPIIALFFFLGVYAGNFLPAKKILVKEPETKQDENFVIPVNWGDLGLKMSSVGIIDVKKFEAVYKSRGGISNETKKLLYSNGNDKITMTSENAAELLNLFWALGLASKNDVLEKGPMADPKYGSLGNFASTGGWTLADGSAMNHYSKHRFFILTADAQQLVERVSKNIYRPCCDNSTYFPDCNHGMAMLGLLELMASQGISESEMYRIALKVNSFWFSDNYQTIAEYLKSNGKDIDKIDPKEILGKNYFSASGFQAIAAEVKTAPASGGGGCGVGGDTVQPQRQQSGCGI